ncbi:dihydrofolate reductase-like domain-containing protein [Dimargaris cristalligena]|uniref:Dihydrofolate reductase n=1 Tax=Dimargaris cristalligena TaxID=215637 RepID=A0A4P9ZNL9_9FUNG|nr:dihydrofolate reductase-like domain-containing protein [Dimargaris cristalligena]|eukprot:RKP34738.1 dihydrofolate reductase-like domain-containing protein [Dimargaris cristalligena]
MADSTLPTTSASAALPLELRIVVAAAREGGGIGQGGDLPWRLAGDMKFFRQLTTGALAAAASAQPRRGLPNTDTPEGAVGSVPVRNAVIMGRRTWESIPPRFRPLKDRINIVISRNPDLLASSGHQTSTNLRVVSSLDLALDYLTSLLPQPLQSNVTPASDVVLGDAYIIGGGQVYDACLAHPLCKKIFLTEVELMDTPADDATPYDTFFGPIPTRFVRQPHSRLVEIVAPVVVSPEAQQESGHRYEFVLLEAL